MKTPSFPDRSYLFSLLVVAAVAAKCLHLYQHAHSISALCFLLYFPTFFIQECFLAIVARLLLHGPTRISAFIGGLVGGSLALVSLCAASAQIGFYYVTGGEVRWDATSSFAGDPAAVKLLMSGITPVLVAAVFLLVLSWVATPILYNKVASLLWTVWKLVAPRNWEEKLPVAHEKPGPSFQKVVWRWSLLRLLTVFFSLTALEFTRPSKPYDHMSQTLLVSLTKIVNTGSRGCTTYSSISGESFPLPDLMSEEFWKLPRGNFKGWAPGSNNFFTSQYAERRPEWLPDDLPTGFYRWGPQHPVSDNSTSSEGPVKTTSKGQCLNNDFSNHYNPVADPLRITNLDLEPYEPLLEAFQNSDIIISHVVLVTMESARKDIFPIKESSYLHEQILKSHGDDLDADEIEGYLSRMTRVAEQVTGESFRSNSSDQPRSSSSPGEWHDPAGPGMGGINVDGVMTGSSLSFKSVLGSHCAVGALTEDFVDSEADADIYQPCIPQILDLFNKPKERLGFESGIHGLGSDYRTSVHNRRWESVFTQSITDQYDCQDDLNENMGFDQSIVRETLKNKNSKYYPPTEPELNYFGYSEAQVKPYMRDVINDAVANENRLFLSHFTSTTHHPWAVPKDFETSEYMGSSGPLNDYLNAVHYCDIWLGEILQLLEEANIANETLVVIVGDHGQAFEEDCGLSGTFENGHISNFRVPLVFRHPHLPRVQVEAATTSMSIIPTILDLLVNTNSLDESDTTVAEDLIHDYESQSLLRPYKTEDNGRQVWNFGVINPGAGLLAVTSAAVPYRLVIPLQEDLEFRFTDLEKDPNELHPLEEWTLDDIVDLVVRHHGEEAGKWLAEADAVGRWWSEEMHRLYQY